MSTLEKIKVGVSKRRNHLNFSHDHESTSGFGVVQPTIAKMILPKSKISLQTKTYTRLAPLPVPTFGRIRVNTTNRFIPISQVFEAYEAFQSQKTINTNVASYIPQCSDYFDTRNLWGAFWTMISDPDFNQTNLNLDPINENNLSDVVSRLPFRIAFWLPRWAIDYNYYKKLFIDGGPSEDDLRAGCELINLLDNDFWRSGSFSFMAQGYDLQYGHILASICSFLHSYDFTNLSSSTFLHSAYIPESVSPNYHQGYRSRNDNLTISPFALFSNQSYGMLRDYSVMPDWFKPGSSDYFAKFFDATKTEGKWYPFIQSAPDNIKALFNTLTFDNADFVFQFRLKSSNIFYLRLPNSSSTIESSTFPFQPFGFITIHLTPFGKRLIGKVLNPLRMYPLSAPTYKFELPRLFAVYKAYFDKYNPGRFKTWYNTAAYKMIHSFYDYGITHKYNIDHVLGSSPYSSYTNFIDFLYDLGNMFATFPVDNITAATDSALNDQPTNNNEIDLFYGGRDNTSGDTGDNSQQYGSLDDSIERVGGLGVKFLERVYSLVNKNSVIGGRIRDYMIVHNMGVSKEERTKLSDDSFYVPIVDIFGTVNNDQTILGEYAGKADGGSQGKKIIYENDELGYLVQLQDIIPFGGYVQSSDHPHINRYDFYQSEFDSLGKEPLINYEVFGRNYTASNDQFTYNNNTFGFLPRYFRDKINNNSSGGDFSLRSSQSQFIPYSLNRLFDNGLHVNMNRVSPELNSRFVQPFTLKNEDLRYVGKYESFGNFDRIFYDTFGWTDNFILHNIHEFHVYSPCKPVSESFDTYDSEIHDSSIEITPN